MLLGCVVAVQSAVAGISLDGSGSAVVLPPSVNSGAVVLSAANLSSLTAPKSVSFASAEPKTAVGGVPTGSLAEMSSDSPSGDIRYGGHVTSGSMVSPVPEPVTSALTVFGMLFLGGTAARLYLARRRRA